MVSCKEFIDWRYSQSGRYFGPALWTVTPLPFSLVKLSPSPPPFRVLISILYTRIRCVRGGMGFWASDRYTPVAKSPYRYIFLDDDISHCLLWVLSFYGVPFQPGMVWLLFGICKGISRPPSIVCEVLFVSLLSTFQPCLSCLSIQYSLPTMTLKWSKAF